MSDISGYLTRKAKELWNWPKRKRELDERAEFYEKSQEEQSEIIVHDTEHLVYAIHNVWLERQHDMKLKEASDRANKLYLLAFMHHDKYFGRR